MTATPGTAVTMFTTQWCGYCVRLKKLMQREGIDFAEVDIDADPELARYTEEVPVTFVDGRQHDYWRVDEGRLRAALQA